METQEKPFLDTLFRLVAFCQANLLIRLLADELDLTRQTIYLWGNKDCGLSEKSAKQRLLEIARIQNKALAEVALRAYRGIETVEHYQPAKSTGVK